MSFLSEYLGDAFHEGMTEEELSAAIEKVVTAERHKSTSDYSKLKASFDKASSDVSKYKKQLSEHLTDEQKKASEKDQLLEELKAQNEEFKKSAKISEFKSKYLSMGYSDELAADTANALFDGDMDKVLANNNTFLTEKEKAIRADVMKGTPVPPASEGGTTVTRESILAINDPVERQTAIAEHIELFE